MKRSLSVVASVGILLLLLGVTLTSSAADTLQVTPLPPVETTDGRAGICYSYYPDPLGELDRPFIDLAYEAGSRWDRFDFAWPTIEPSRGEGWNFEEHEAIVDELHAGGITNIVGILQMTPKWAASECTREIQSLSLADSLDERHPPGAGAFAAGVVPQDTWEDSWTKKPPQGLYEEWDDWGTEDGDSAVNWWGRFVYHTVDYYSDRGVTNWEMWNEAEWDMFWCGTSTDYARLLEVGYRATKAACPDCTVLFAGLHYWENPDFHQWVLNTLRDKPEAEKHNYFFDVMSVHFYSRSSDIYDKINEIQAGMVARGMEHPIWLTETGVPIWGDSYGAFDGLPEGNWRATIEEAASYAIQSYANARAAGASRYFHFRASDDWCDRNQDGDCSDDGVDSGMTEFHGLVRDNRTLRPSYVAYQVATRYLISPTMVTNWSYSNGVRRVTFWGTPHGKVSVLWNTKPGDPVTFSYPATLATALLVDQRGDQRALDVTVDDYEIQLPGATADNGSGDYFIGGEPYLIIEEDTVPPSQAEVEPISATTYASAIPITWWATDDQAGIWGFEVQVSHDPTGPWTDWLGIFDTAGTSSAAYEGGQHDTQYCFRARGWDRAGNRGEWSDTGADQCTRLDIEREVRLEVDAVFGDENGNGDWDTGAGEPQLDTVSFRLVSSAGSMVASQDAASSWVVTHTLTAGDYTLVIEPPDWPSPPGGWLPRHLTVSVKGGSDLQTISYDEVGLYRHRSSSYFPIIARGG